jgi:hypothetical protein
VVADNLLDLAVILKLLESLAGQAAVDLETVDKGGNGDQTEVLDVLLETLGGLLLEDDGVVGLVLDWEGVSIYSPWSVDGAALRERI